MSNMTFRKILTLNDGLQNDFSTNKVLSFLFRIPRRFRSQIASSVYLTPSEVSAILCEVSAILCEPCSRKIEIFFCHGEIFVLNTRGPLGCLLGFWPSVWAKI